MNIPLKFGVASTNPNKPSDLHTQKAEKEPFYATRLVETACFPTSSTV
jgi:hypothetical protein